MTLFWSDAGSKVDLVLNIVSSPRRCRSGWGWRKRWRHCRRFPSFRGQQYGGGAAAGGTCGPTPGHLCFWLWLDVWPRLRVVCGEILTFCLHQAPSEGRMVRERRPVEDVKQRMKEMPPAVSSALHIRTLSHSVPALFIGHIFSSPLEFMLTGQRWLTFHHLIVQVNLWALHDPYAVLGEDKPFKSGKTQFTLGCRSDSRVSFWLLLLTDFLSPPQESATKFLRVWMKVGRGRESERLLFRTSGAGSGEPVRTSLMSCRMMIPLVVKSLISVFVAVDPPEQKLKNGPTFPGKMWTEKLEKWRANKWNTVCVVFTVCCSDSCQSLSYFPIFTFRSRLYFVIKQDGHVTCKQNKNTLDEKIKTC